MAELSHTLGTIRTDAPIDTAEGSLRRGRGQQGRRRASAAGAGDPLADPALRAGRCGPGRPPAEEQSAEAAGGRACRPAPCPVRALSGGLPPRRDGQAGQPQRGRCSRRAWYAVQDTTVYPLEDADLLRLLDNADVTLDVFNSAPLYAKSHGRRRLGQQHPAGTASWPPTCWTPRRPSIRWESWLPSYKRRCGLHLRRLPGRRTSWPTCLPK